MAEERRVVTVLFADVAGSTALGDALDPEDVRVLLRRYYDVAREIVIEHGGILEKFIGDAVVAVFGFPHTHDDDPQRAVAAALSLRDRVRADPGLGERLPIRLGINTGEVVAARESATGAFPLRGDAVNVAARLQQAAESWGILCGERTVGSVRGGFDFGPVMTVEVRGKAQPIRALALLGRAAVLPVALRMPLIGRTADLQQLELVARRALHERRPFLASIIAPAGVGKTRLLEEFLERLPSIEPRATVAIAQCMPYGQRLTYWPLRGVLYIFEFVMQPRGELPLLMLALTRPELLDRRPAWGGGRRNYVSVSLEPLSDAEIGQLAERLLEGRSPELVERVVSRAEGNPFFAGELVRSCLDRPTIDQLPDTVQATVLARLDQLTPDERRTIQMGSVFGRAFRLSGLRALEPSLKATDEIAERLMDKDLIRPAGGDVYGFRHILIREVAYQTLTRSERGRLHAAAAEWMERIAGEREDALAERIAYHYR